MSFSIDGISIVLAAIIGVVLAAGRLYLSHKGKQERQAAAVQSVTAAVQEVVPVQTEEFINEHKDDLHTAGGVSNVWHSFRE
jgi:hypothetical protein